MINPGVTFKASVPVQLISVNVLHLDFSLLQMILKYCGINKEVIQEPSEKSPLTLFTQLQSPGHQTNTATSPQEGSVETTVDWVVPEDLPIDLRVKIAVCLIHVRQLLAAKVTMEKLLHFCFHFKSFGEILIFLS